MIVKKANSKITYHVNFCKPAISQILRSVSFQGYKLRKQTVLFFSSIREKMLHFRLYELPLSLFLSVVALRTLLSSPNPRGTRSSLSPTWQQVRAVSKPSLGSPPWPHPLQPAASPDSSASLLSFCPSFLFLWSLSQSQQPLLF